MGWGVSTEEEDRYSAGGSREDSEVEEESLVMNGLELANHVLLSAMASAYRRGDPLTHANTLPLQGREQENPALTTLSFQLCSYLHTSCVSGPEHPPWH